MDLAQLSRMRSVIKESDELQERIAEAKRFRSQVNGMITVDQGRRMRICYFPQPRGEEKEIVLGDAGLDVSKAILAIANERVTNLEKEFAELKFTPE